MTDFMAKEEEIGIYGGSGNDFIKGGSSNDRLYGQNGRDRIYGGIR